MRTADGKLPFTSLDKLEDSEGSFAQRRGLAPYLGRPCVFGTNVALLSDTHVSATLRNRICEFLMTYKVFVSSTVTGR